MRSNVLGSRAAGWRLAWAALALLTGCAGLGAPAATATPVSIWSIPSYLEGTHWKLVELNGQPPVAGTEITLDFIDGKASGSAGCNQYRGPFADTASTEVKFTITVMACFGPPGVMEQEAAYTQALSAVTERALEEGRLEFRDAGGTVTLVFEAA